MRGEVKAVKPIFHRKAHLCLLPKVNEININNMKNLDGQHKPQCKGTHQNQYSASSHWVWRWVGRVGVGSGRVRIGSMMVFGYQHIGGLEQRVWGLD